MATATENVVVQHGMLTVVVRCREELEYVANTLIFVLSGVIIAGKIWESSASGTHQIRAADWGYAILLWLYLLVGCLRCLLQPPCKSGPAVSL